MTRIHFSSILTLLLFFISTSSQAQDKWEDVTSKYFTNADFSTDGDKSDWALTGKASSLGDVRDGAIQMWDGKWKLKRTISNAPNGHYRLSFNAFYRRQYEWTAFYEYCRKNEEQHGFVTANNAEKNVYSIFDFYATSTTRGYDYYAPNGTGWWGNPPYYPNSLSCSSLLFSEGLYADFIEFDVTDGKITISFYNDETIESNWFVVDNIRLERQSDSWVAVSSLSLSETSLSLNTTKRQTLKATLLPANASDASVTWTSSDTYIVQVSNSGRVQGRHPGKAQIICQSNDNQAIKAVCEVTVEDPLPATGKWLDVTNKYIADPSFATFTTAPWIVERSSNTGNIAANYGVMEMWNTKAKIYRKWTDVPEGSYRLSMQGLYRNKTHELAWLEHLYGQDAITGFFYGNSQAKALNCQYEYHTEDIPEYDYYQGFDGYFYINSMQFAEEAFSEEKLWNSLIFDVTSDGVMEVGVYNNEYVSDNWLVFDNVKIEQFVANGVDVESISLPASVNIGMAEERALTPSFVPENATVKSCTWTSSDPEIVSVGKTTGIVTGKGSGEAIITATSTDNPSATASCTVKVTTSEPSAENIVFNEVMTGNIDCFLSDAINFDKWVELYNPSGMPTFIGGCYLSDDEQNLTKWHIPEVDASIPAHGYKVVWFSSNDIRQTHSTFDLDCDGGTLYLSDKNQKLIATLDYPESMGRASFARTTDGGNQWSWTATPTPGETNNDAAYAEQQLETPVVYPQSQLFEGSVSVRIALPSNVTARYTLDGSTPTPTNGEVSTDGMFTFNKTTNLRVRYFRKGYLPSSVTTCSYILKEREYTVPVISVVTDNAYLYDAKIGCTVRGDGTNGRTGNGQSSPVNWNMNWDRPVSFQYILPDGTVAINQEVNYSVSGGWTRANTPQAFKLKATKKYEGKNSLDYPFWEAKPFIKSKTIQVRAGGNDGSTRIKDAMIQGIIQKSGVNVDVCSYQPAVVYVNGTYKGVMNVREPNNKHYVYSNFGLDEKEIEMYEQSPDSGAYMMVGTDETLERIYTLGESAADDDVYEELCSLIDIDEYAWYMAAKLHGGDWDWPDNNLKAWRKLEDGRYRYTFFDSDNAFSTADPFSLFDTYQWHTYDYVYDWGYSMQGEIKFVTLFQNMLQNDKFRRRFVDIMSLMAGSVFNEKKAADIVDQMAANINPMMAYEGKSATSRANDIKNCLSGRANALATSMRNYAHFQLNTAPQSARLTTNNSAARLFVNEVEVPYAEFDGFLFAPATIKAVAPHGYKFVGWKGVNHTSRSLFTLGSEWNYYDQGSLDGTDWKAADFNDEAWATGEAPLGYGKNGIVTFLDYGDDSNNKRTTSYLRKEFTLNNISDGDDYRLNFTVDDGFIVYINGTEAGRYHLNSGTINYSTLASTADSNPDSGSMQLNAQLFKKGKNIIAVEVHNNNLNSTDLMWNAELLVTASEESIDEFVSTNSEIEMGSGSIDLEAVFAPLESGDEGYSANIAPVRINEVSAANSIFINDNGKKADWVELYNTTDKDIDVNGMYLSDNITNPAKYQISASGTQASTIIPAHGHLVIWCDKQEAASQLHAPFKLSADGGDIILTASDNSWNDVLNYTAHEGNETAIRYPDGSDNVFITPMPTISKANLQSTYMTEVEQNPSGVTILPLESEKSNIRIAYVVGRLVITGDEALDGNVTVFSAAGQKTLNARCHVPGNRAYVDVDHLHAGIYVAAFTDNNGKKATCKFLIQ